MYESTVTKHQLVKKPKYPTIAKMETKTSLKANIVQISRTASVTAIQFVKKTFNTVLSLFDEKKHRITYITHICNALYDGDIEYVRACIRDVDEQHSGIRHHICIVIKQGNTDMLQLLYEKGHMNMSYDDCTKNYTSFLWFWENGLLDRVYNKYAMLLNIFEHDEYEKISMWSVCERYLDELTKTELNNLLLNALNHKTTIIDLYIINQLLQLTYVNIDHLVFNCAYESWLKYVFKHGIIHNISSSMNMIHLDLAGRNETALHHIKKQYKRIDYFRS